MHTELAEQPYCSRHPGVPQRPRPILSGHSRREARLSIQFTPKILFRMCFAPTRRSLISTALKLVVSRYEIQLV